MKLVTTVSSTVIIPGTHKWKEAPDNRSYLRDDHHHYFRITVTTKVDEKIDRDIEFHDLNDTIKHSIVSLYKIEGGIVDFQKSCEDIATDILSFMVQTYGYDITSVKVAEDEFNWGEVHRS